MVSVKSLLLSGLVAVASAAPANTELEARQNPLTPLFHGKGQLRCTATNPVDGQYPDYGCLTDEGKWTTNEALCGTFTADPTAPSNGWSYSLTTPAGPCVAEHVFFRCGPNKEPGYLFATFPVTGRGSGQAVAIGQYGNFAGVGGEFPPLPTDPALEIRLYSSLEAQKKIVWLTWKSLE